MRVAWGFTAVWGGVAVLAAGATVLSFAVPVRRRARDAGLRGPALPRPTAGLVLPAFLVVASTLGVDGYALFTPLYAADLGQRAATTDFLVLAGATLVARIGGAGLLDRYPSERVALPAFLLCTAGPGVIALAAGPAGLLIGTALLGVGQAFAFPVLIHLALQRTGHGGRTAAVAVITACHDLTYGLAGLTFGAVVDAAGYATAFLAAAGASAAGMAALAVATWKKTRRTAAAAARPTARPQPLRTVRR